MELLLDRALTPEEEAWLALSTVRDFTLIAASGGQGWLSGMAWRGATTTQVESAKLFYTNVCRAVGWVVEGATETKTRPISKAVQQHLAVPYADLETTGEPSKQHRATLARDAAQRLATLDVHGSAVRNDSQCRKLADFLLKEAEWHLSRLKQDTIDIGAPRERVEHASSTPRPGRQGASRIPAEAVQVLLDRSVSMVSPLHEAALQWLNDALFFDLSQGRRRIQVINDLVSAGASVDMASTFVDGTVQQLATLKRIGIRGWDEQRLSDAEKAFRAAQREANLPKVPSGGEDRSEFGDGGSDGESTAMRDAESRTPPEWVPVEAIRLLCGDQNWLTGTPAAVGSASNTALALVNAAAMFRIAQGQSGQSVMTDLIAAGMPDVHVRSMAAGIENMWAQAKRAMGTSSAHEYARRDLLQRERDFARVSRSSAVSAVRTDAVNRYTCARCGQAVAAISVVSNPQTGGFDEVCQRCLRAEA